MDNAQQDAARSRPRAHFLVGATACGKSAVAHYIAEREGRLVVSADSMNVYRGMDIGTAKPTAYERKKVDYAGIDLAEPSEKFSVADYLESVRSAWQSGREILVAGGTGLYIKCLTEGFDDVPPEQADLRAELEELGFDSLVERARRDAAELYDQLNEDDRRNPRRLIRILERTAGFHPALAEPAGNRRHKRSWNSSPKPTMIGLHVDRAELHKRIEKRVDAMYANGLLDEARILVKRNLSQTALQAIGYAEAFAVLHGEMTIREAREKTVIRTRQLAKRQMTWFRNQLKVEWIDAADYPDMERLAEAVTNAWKKHGPAPICF